MSLANGFAECLGCHKDSSYTERAICGLYLMKARNGLVQQNQVLQMLQQIELSTLSCEGHITYIVCLL